MMSLFLCDSGAVRLDRPIKGDVHVSTDLSTAPDTSNLATWKGYVWLEE